MWLELLFELLPKPQDGRPEVVCSGWTLSGDVDGLLNAALQPSGVRIQDLHIVGVKLVPTIGHMTADWGRGTFVFSKSLD